MRDRFYPPNTHLCQFFSRLRSRVSCALKFPHLNTASDRPAIMATLICETGPPGSPRLRNGTGRRHQHHHRQHHRQQPARTYIHNIPIKSRRLPSGRSPVARHAPPRPPAGEEGGLARFDRTDTIERLLLASAPPRPVRPARPDRPGGSPAR